MPDLVNVTRAELFKLARRPAAWTLLAATVVLGETFGYLIPYLSYRSGSGTGPIEGASKADILASTMPDQIIANAVGGMPVFAGALALAFGALMFGGEYGWGTIKTLFTQGPGRLVMLAGQVSALVISIAVGVLVILGFGALSATAIAGIENQPMHWLGAVDLLKGYGAGVLILTMWAMLGATLGVALRGVALPIGFGIVWVLGIENLLSAMAGTVLSALKPLRDVLPGVNAGGLASSLMSNRPIDPPPGVSDSVDASRALITLTAYLLICAAFAAWNLRRRDVV